MENSTDLEFIFIEEGSTTPDYKLKFYDKTKYVVLSDLDTTYYEPFVIVPYHVAVEMAQRILKTIPHENKENQ